MSVSLARQRLAEAVRLRCPSMWQMWFLASKDEKYKVPRHLPSELRLRVGNMLKFGINDREIATAFTILDKLTSKWRSLTLRLEAFDAMPSTGSYDFEVTSADLNEHGYLSRAAIDRHIDLSRESWLESMRKDIPENTWQWTEMSSQHVFGLRSLHTEFIYPVQVPEKLSIYHKLEAMPRTLASTFRLSSVMYAHTEQRVVATTEEALSWRCRTTGRSVIMPKAVKQSLQNAWGAQSESLDKACRELLTMIVDVGNMEQRVFGATPFRRRMDSDATAEYTATTEETSPMAAAENTAITDEASPIAAAEDAGTEECPKGDDFENQLRPLIHEDGFANFPSRK